MTTTTYPNGQALASSALTPTAVTNLVQTLTCGMIGINPPDYGAVRVDWVRTGQPFVAAPGQDVCFVMCVPEDVEYSRVRDRVMTGTGPVTENWTYTKGWRAAWTFYGPNAEDRARMVRSALFMDYFNDALNAAGLYPLSDPPEVTRAPENINGQWWERADFHVIMYEQVTETIQDGAVVSVEVAVYDGSEQDPVADIIVTKE